MPAVTLRLVKTVQVCWALLQRLQLLLDDIADLLFVEGLKTFLFLDASGAAADATELSEVCKSLVLSMSDRTAHRIIAEAD